MHEIGVMRDVLETALKTARENDGSRITKVTLKVGVMSGLIPHYCSMMFDFLTKDTIAQGCELECEELPAVFKCCECGELTYYDRIEPEFVCHACSSPKLKLIDGFKARIESIAII